MKPQERVKFWRDLDLSDLELLRATFVHHSFAPHAHEGFAIGVINRGAITTSYRREQVDMPAGTIIVINPGELHTGAPGSEQGWTYRMFYLPAGKLQQLASDLAGAPRDVPFFPGPVIFDNTLAYLLTNIHMTFEAQINPVVERESLFWWLMAELILRHADDPPPLCEVKQAQNYVARVQDYIESHYSDDVSLQQLAGLVNLNPCYLLRLFTQTVGLPPHAYLNQVRIRQAKRLLAGGCAIAEAAQQTGFSDQSHMTKRFKRVYGITPGQYLLSLN
ncbi:MAG: HTH-type transcriptional activator RhaS [Anaerolineae bacterium]|nr:HTH-type transcriptional activator RhaS [Anaerolineae bacterium]